MILDIEDHSSLYAFASLVFNSIPDVSQLRKKRYAITDNHRGMTYITTNVI